MKKSFTKNTNLLSMKGYVYIGLLLSFSAFSQSIERFVIGSTGSTFSIANSSIDYTVGELAITEINSSGSIINQGFHQGILKLELFLSPKLFLQGSSLGGLPNVMNDALRINNYLPLTSPYLDGITCESSVFDTAGNDAIIDWIWLELRDKNDFNTVLASRSALLKADGNVVDVDGFSIVKFVNIEKDDYYLAVNHRNHLGLISANPISFGNDTVVIDFTSDANSVMGSNGSLFDLGNNQYALISGDVDSNGQIQNNDIQFINPFIGNSGYLNADTNMNGQVQNSDINIYVIPNQGKGQQF